MRRWFGIDHSRELSIFRSSEVNWFKPLSDISEVTDLSVSSPTGQKSPHRLETVRNVRDLVMAANIMLGTVWICVQILAGIQGHILAAAWTIVLIVSAVFIAVVGAVLHDLFYWRLPVRRARKVLTELSRGAAPLDDLQSLRRGMRCLMPSILDLAHRERSLHAQIARLEMEVQQRVVNRTESLERKLGLLQFQASRDALTGLFNRRALELDLPKIIQGCRQTLRDLQLLMIDVDDFKTLNDTLGHIAGDDLLRSIGQVMRSTLRDGDVAFRYGGDEFVVLLPGGNTAAANALADRLKSLVDGLTKHHRELARRPQLSIGVASLSEESMNGNAERLIEVADRRLYACKHSRPKSEQRVA